MIGVHCFDCKYADIFESGHEWLECVCKKTGKNSEPFFDSCPMFEKREKQTDESETD